MKLVKHKDNSRNRRISKKASNFLIRCLDNTRVILLVTFGSVLGAKITENSVGRIGTNNNIQFDIVKIFITAILIIITILGQMSQEKAVDIYRKPPLKPSAVERVYIGWGHIITLHTFFFRYIIGSIFLFILSYLVGTIIVIFRSL